MFAIRTAARIVSSIGSGRITAAALVSSSTVASSTPQVHAWQRRHRPGTMAHVTPNFSSTAQPLPSATSERDDQAASTATLDYQNLPVYQAIHKQLSTTFSPVHLEILNESHKHNVPRDSETHFKVLVVSEAFESSSMIARHRQVHAALAKQLAGPIHALSIVAKTPQQWQSMIDQGQATIEPSPPCRGGDGSLPPR